jgi:hypothetical protein
VFALGVLLVFWNVGARRLGESVDKDPAVRTIPLSVAYGPEHDPGRVFSVPVECNQVKGGFELAAYGNSRLSSSFAKRCHAQVQPDESLSRQMAADGGEIFAGTAQVWIAVGGGKQRVRAVVINDRYCQTPEKEGLIGFDVLRGFQWEVNPLVPSLTLRPAGTAASRKPLAVLPLTLGTGGCFLKVKVRNADATIALMPGSSFVQANAALQHKWDMLSGKPAEIEAGQRFGEVRTLLLRGLDAVELTPEFRETDLYVALVGDPNRPEHSTIESGLGQCVLNRLVYCVDVKTHQFRILARATDDHGRSNLPATAPVDDRESDHVH